MASKSSGDNPSLLLSAVTELLRTHPLYVSYLIFFSPYILKLLSFLSPLLLLLLLLLLLCSTSFLLGGDENASTSSVMEVEAYKIIFENVHDFVTDSADEVEVCKKIVKEAVAPEIVKSCCSSTTLQDVEKSTVCDEDELSSCMDPSPTSAGKSRNAKSSNWDDTEIIKHMVCSSAVNTPEKNEREDDEEKLVKAAVGVGFDKAEGPLMTAVTQKSGSNAGVDERQESTNSTDLNKTASLKSSSSWSEAGSMRRSEKEWRRTLACKLFEERHNKGGMDMLWETYEAVGAGHDGSSRGNARESDVDEEEEDDEVGKMCCLQALKMSSGKVNLGIGRKNMMKLSKTLTRFGWLHKTSSDKNVTRK